MKHCRYEIYVNDPENINVTGYNFNNEQITDKNRGIYNRTIIYMKIRKSTTRSKDVIEETLRVSYVKSKDKA